MKYWITRANDAKSVMNSSGQSDGFTLISEAETLEDATRFVENNYPDMQLWNTSDKSIVYIDSPFQTQELIVIEERS